MKPLNILFFTLSYLTTYLGISELINYSWNLEMSFVELLVIGLIFSILLIVLLVFNVPDKIAERFSRKPEVVIYKDNDLSNDVIEQDKVVQQEIVEQTSEKVEELY